MAQPDTARLSDTLGPTIIEEEVEAPPPEVVDDSYTDYDTEQEDKKYFLFKWEYRDSFRVLQRKVPDDRIKKMQQDDDFWYANSAVKTKTGSGNETGPRQEKINKEEKTPDKENGSSYTPLGERSWFQALLWIVIVVGFAAAVAIYLAGNNVGLFRKKTAAIATETDTDEIPEDIFAINYQKEIDKAAANTNYRLAIRLMFLRLLKQMAERNIIQYKQDRTNFDYLLQLQSTGYYNNFFRITRNYEYSWYGKFPISEEAYKLIRSDFNRFDRQLY